MPSAVEWARWIWQPERGDELDLHRPDTTPWVLGHSGSGLTAHDTFTTRGARQRGETFQSAIAGRRQFSLRIGVQCRTRIEMEAWEHLLAATFSPENGPGILKHQQADGAWRWLNCVYADGLGFGADENDGMSARRFVLTFNTDGAPDWYSPTDTSPSFVTTGSGLRFSPRLIVSGNEVTDATRAAGIEGDGQTPPAGYGLFQSATNLALHSNHLNTAPWAGSNTTVTEGSAGDPYGGATANSVSCTNAASTRYQDVTVAEGTFYAFSFYAKAGSKSACAYRVYDLTHSADIVARTAYTPGTTGTPAGNGYRRITVVYSSPTGCVSVRLSVQDEAAGTTGTVLIWQVQNEAAAYGDVCYSTPAVDTGAAPVARAAADVRAPGHTFDQTRGWFMTNVIHDGGDILDSFIFLPHASDYSSYFYATADRSDESPFGLIDGVNSGFVSVTGDVRAPGAQRLYLYTWSLDIVAQKATLSIEIRLLDGTLVGTQTATVDCNFTSTIDQIAFGSEGDEPLNGRFRWVAMGKGAPPSLVTFASDTCPTEAEFTPEALVTVIWPAVDTRLAPTFPVTFRTEALAIGRTSTVHNVGSAPSAPTIVLSGPLHNPTAEHVDQARALRFVLDLAAGETLTIRGGFGQKSATLRRAGVDWDVLYQMTPESLFWELLPGDNRIYIAGSPPGLSGAATLSYTARYRALGG